jgi:hypothetical protein
MGSLIGAAEGCDFLMHARIGMGGVEPPRRTAKRKPKKDRRALLL